MQLPEFPAGFTADFLTRVLGETHLGSAGRITKVETVPLGEGTGMMADISKISITIEGSVEAPTRYIAKYAAANPTNREIAVSYNLYERESRYYAELDPLTDAISPQIYFSGTDGQNLLILMEDMSDYDVGSQVVGATLAQTELAIDELAKLHGAFWGKVEDLDWVPGIANSYHADNMHNLAQIGWDNMVDVFGAHVPDEIRRQKSAFLAAIPALQAQQNESIRTLCHGDFRMENLLYGNRAEHHRLAIIDWQGPLRGRGMFDVALFLGQSTTTEVRRLHERELLNRYSEGLSMAGVPDLDGDNLWEEYRRTLLYDWVYTAVVAGTLDTSNEVAFAWMSQMVARQSAASIDLNVFECLP